MIYQIIIVLEHKVRAAQALADAIKEGFNLFTDVEGSEVYMYGYLPDGYKEPERGIRGVCDLHLKTELYPLPGQKENDHNKNTLPSCFIPYDENDTSIPKEKFKLFETNPTELKPEIEETLKGQGLNFIAQSYLLDALDSVIDPELLDRKGYDISKPISDAERRKFMTAGDNGKLKFHYGAFVDFLVEKCEAVVCEGTLWFLMPDGTYTCDVSALHRLIDWANPDLEIYKIKATVDKIKLRAPVKKPAPTNYLFFQKPGKPVICIDTDTWHSVPLTSLPDGCFITNILPHEVPLTNTGCVDWDDHTSVIDNFLHKIACGDPQIELQLEEVAGYPLLRSSTRKKAFFLKGSHDNGKSTFIQLLQKTYGDRNCSNVTLQQLNDRFSKYMMVGKLANFSDDLADGSVSPEVIATLKTLICGGWLTVEKKNVDAEQAKITSKQIYCCNSMFHMKDRTSAVMEKIIFVPLNGCFTPATDPDFDPDIDKKLHTEPNYRAMIVRALKGLKRILETGTFTESDAAQDTKAEYDIDNSTVAGFIDDMDWLEDDKRSECNFAVISTLYQLYCDYMEGSVQKRVSQRSFMEEFCERMHGQVIRPKLHNGDRPRVFILNGTDADSVHIDLEVDQARKRLLNPRRY